MARTLVDLAAVLPDDALRRAVKQAAVNRLLDLDAVAASCDRAVGRATRRLRALVDVPAPPTRSELEDRFLALCDRAGLPRPLVNVTIGPYEVDFFWPDHGLVVETDGARVHDHHLAFEDDRIRDADLTLRGLTVVRFTWRRITERPDEVVRALRALIRR